MISSTSIQSRCCSVLLALLATVVLADNNLTADEYVSMIYRISADPVLAKAYADARDQ
jgi:hypothetical protein